MSKQYYEAHVTITGNENILRPIVTGLRWKFSTIDGDANLGDGVKLYATRQFNTRMGKDGVVRELIAMANILDSIGANILRRKVELVIYDDRAGLVECSGARPECV